MTENWQAEPSPWLSPGREQPEPGPQAGEPAAPQGPGPMRLHVNGDVVSIGQPPMADPPRLTPVAGPAGIGVPTGPAGISVPQIAAPIDEGQFAPQQFSVPPQFAPPPPAPVEVPPPPPPPFLDASYGVNSYAQSPYSEVPYTASTYAPPYADKPVDNQPFVEAPAPPAYSPPNLVEPVRPEPVYTPGPTYTPEPVYTPEPDFKPEPVRGEPIVAEQLSAPEPKAYIEPRYIEPTSIDSPTTTLPVTYAESQYSQLTPVPHPSYQQRPAPPAEPPVSAPTSSPSGVPTAPPIVGGSDGHSTMLVAVGTVQPRAPQPPATVEDAERVLGAAVDSLDADPDLYSIGTVTDGAVCLIPDEGRWAVFLADAGQRRFAGTFDDPMMAAVHFAGVLLLASAERGAIPKPSAPAALPGQSAAPAGQNSQNGQYTANASQNNHYAGPADQSPGAGSDPLAQFLAGPPITPLAGDPPTTLYTEHRLTVLTPGTEVDRFGDQLGNTVYAARTRYPHRSLPPDYIEREYRVYRVRNPLRALTGTAIPWFGQPGGGTAYLLPRPIADLLREGVLVELPAATVAPS